jgi:hypothetical protein
VLWLSETRDQGKKWIRCSSFLLANPRKLLLQRLNQRRDKRKIFLKKNHEKLSDPRARSFWISSFGAQARMVPWSEFCHVMTVASGSTKLDSREVFFFFVLFDCLLFFKFLFCKGGCAASVC